MGVQSKTWWALRRGLTLVACCLFPSHDLAAGLARVGKRPVVYSGALFLCTRALEQIRDDVCYPNLDVTLVGTGASGFLGFTHNFEGEENYFDLIKNLPNLLRVEGVHRIKDVLKRKEPVFIKL